MKTLKLNMKDLRRAFLRSVVTHVEQRQIESRSTTVDRSIDQLSWSRKYLPHYFRKPPSAMHVWLAGELQAARKNRGTKLNVIGPRGGAKSTVGNTAYIIRCAVEATESYILVLGKTEKMAAKQLAHIKREIEENPHLAADYPEACGRGSTWTESEIRLKNGVQIQAFGVGQNIRGARNAADRPTLVVCDDLQDKTAITSNGIREDDWTWFVGDVLKIGDGRTNFINLATALHREAIALKLSNAPGWKSGIFAAIISWPSNMGLWEQWADILHDHSSPQAEARAEQFYADNKPAMDAGAELLWPEHESLYELMMMRESEGRRPFEREKQSKVAGVDENEWPDEYFDDHIWFDEWPTGWQCKTVALDPSKGKDKRSDYSAIVDLMVGNDGVLYVDADLQRRAVDRIVTDFVSHVHDFRPEAYGLEANAWQDLLGGAVEAEFVGRGMLDAAPSLINNQVNKAVRIRRLGPYLAQRRVKFKRGSAGALLLVGQLRDFPDPHSHDDGPDALEMAERLAKEVLYGNTNEDHPDIVAN